MISTTNRHLIGQSRALEGFLEAHGEGVSAGLVEASLSDLLTSLRDMRRQVKAADRRLALRTHEAQVARRRRRAAVVAVRQRMIRLRGLVEAVAGPVGPRWLLILRGAISRHPMALDGQARRAVHALRVRAAEGVRLRLASWEVCPARLAAALEPLQLELAAAVTEGFRTAERLFAAQRAVSLRQREALQRLRAVRKIVWKACHQVQERRLAARVHRMLGRRRRTAFRSLRAWEQGVWECTETFSTRLGPSGADLARLYGVQGSVFAVRSAGTDRKGDFPPKLALVPADRRKFPRSGASSPRVRASCHFLAGPPSRRGSRPVSGGLRRWGRAPPGYPSPSVSGTMASAAISTMTSSDGAALRRPR